MLGNTLRAEGTIKVDGVETPIKINMNSIRIMTQQFGIKLDELDKFMSENEVEGICGLAYCGVKAAAAKSGQVYKVKYEKFCADFLEDEEGIQTVMELLSVSANGEEEGNTEESGNE